MATITFGEMKKRDADKRRQAVLEKERERAKQIKLETFVLLERIITQAQKCDTGNLEKLRDELKSIVNIFEG
jgi:hypothetical protein